ncbi:MAG: hypothetical protein WAV00_13740 [Nocardioides sp.]
MTTTVTAPATAPATENAWAGQGAVLLDIGGEVGALVVTMPASMVGAEVEIRPLRGTAGSGAHRGHHHGDHDGEDHGEHHHGDHEHLAHVAVVARPVAGGEVPSLVFPELPDGGYELFGKGQPAAVSLRVDVVGGEVTVTDWPG